VIKIFVTKKMTKLTTFKFESVKMFIKLVTKIIHSVIGAQATS
jgi:hypothetical protein